MDIIELLKSAFLGLVEGITEWLPISSTGHMILVDEFIKLNVTEEFWNMFLVVIQLGAILAVCVLFIRDLLPFGFGKTRQECRDTWSLWGKIIVGCLPAAIIGIPLDDFMEEHLYNAWVVAAALIVYGIAFIVIERWRANKLAARVAEEAAANARPGGAHFAAPAVAIEPTQGGDFGAITSSRTSPTRPPWASAASRCSRSSPAHRAPAPPSSAAFCWAPRALWRPNSRSSSPFPSCSARASSSS